MSDQNRLRTLQLIIDTLKQTDDNPALRLATIRGILFGESSRDPELAALTQALPPIEEEVEYLDGQVLVADQLTSELDRAQRAWVALWHAADAAETYLAETVKESVLHMRVYHAVIDNNPGSALFEKYQVVDDEDDHDQVEA